ncbi:MAG TPA: cytochrome b/b6 domain-containing protein, partial [Burkholderiaceae bacterium]|nr:cytochrome b/b6 domain-containing protein [Burkholderiaceae bacterium]
MANDAIVASRTSEPLPLLRWQSKAVQPAWVRIAHWTNAIAVLILVGSGWRIYNASPIFGFRFPKELVLGGWLGGALLWHFAAMWLLVGNAAVYLLLTVVSGHLQQRFFPLTPRQILADLGAALRGRLDHSNFSQYNALQKCAYLGVWVLLLIVVVSGLAVWKSV